ncbi:hypothetical protein ON010_g706 [Phytophthora cinnamomi]|nr:hypothetical protein ON010_g706 [Phytophthora cinnamomi]
MAGKRLKKTRQPPHVQRFVANYVKVHPRFYMEELQTALRQRFGAGTSGFSASDLVRLLIFDLGLSRKVLERRAREVVPREIEDFLAKMKCWYKYPEQLVFVDETSKNGLDSMRRYAWSARGSRAVVRVPFSRGKRVNILAACDVSGFLLWNCTRVTYTRVEFDRAFMQEVVPKLNPWPLPRSIAVIDNARIHMYGELEAAVHACGAVLLYLPPYCPQFNPIEIMFG